MTKIVLLHYYKLVFRSVFFLAATAVYVVNRICNTGEVLGGFEKNHVLLTFIWLIFFFEMLFRFFPSSLESMGCQKQFARNFSPISQGEQAYRLQSAKSTLAVVAFWIGLNGIFGVFYLTRVIDAGIMILLSLFYSVCDIICILFFCPFQTWFMRNKCCTTCRIYNWDYAMMFTPLLFVNNIFARSLFGVAVLLLVVWEIAVYRHPERFIERTNQALSCSKCKEKLCHQKRQLQGYLEKGKFNLKGNLLFVTKKQSNRDK